MNPPPFTKSFGDYELIEEIARGGMGVVYKAQQKSLHRTVALKMILSGRFASRQEVLRFQAEAEAAAHLRHPNIVAVHETGEQDGQRFFSMDFVAGRSLADIVRDGPLNPRRAAQYAKTMAEAMHYAHLQGILHRDLKPSNVLIDADDQPRITDFGLAKRFEGDTGLTMSGQTVGSPNFMSPEQCGLGSSRAERLDDGDGGPHGQAADKADRPHAPGTSVKSAFTNRGTKVGPWSDVYGLGATLYFLMTGRPPFLAETIQEVLVQLREQDPPPPRLLNPSIPRDLETIALKCLEKEPAKRYDSAQALAEDLGRFLRDEPIRARPVGTVSKAWRWCKRKPALSGALAALWTVLVAGLIAVSWQSRARQEALKETRRTLYAAQMNLVQKAWDDGNLTVAQSLLRAWVPAPGQEDLRGFEWRHYWKLCRDESMNTFRDDPPVDVQSVAVSGDGTTIAFGGNFALGRTWRFDSGLSPIPFKGSPDYVRSLVFSPDGSEIICGNAEGTVKIWKTQGTELLATLSGFKGDVECVRVSSDGRMIAAAIKPSGMIRLFRRETLTEVASIHPPPNERPALDFSPDGRTLAFTRSDRTVGLWDLHRNQEVRTLTSEPSGLSVYLDFSPDGRWLAAAGVDGLVRLWDLAKSSEPSLLQAHKTWVSSVAFSHDGRRFGTSSIDSTIKLWDAESRVELRTFHGHSNWVNNVVFTPDDSKLISSSDDQTVKIWDAAASSPPLRLEPDVMRAFHSPPLAATIFSPDGKLLVTANLAKEIVLWDAATEQPVARLPGSALIHHAAFSSDGRWLATAGDDGKVQVWDVNAREHAIMFEGHTAAVRAVSFSRDGRWLASVGEDQSTRLWDLAARQPAALIQSPNFTIVPAVFSLDGRSLVTGHAEGLQTWDILLGKPTSQVPGFWLRTSVVSPNRRTLVCQTDYTNGLLWDLETRRVRAELDGQAFVHRMAYSPDGTYVAAACQDNVIRIWESAAGKLLHTLRGHGGWVVWIDFAPEGKTLASASNDGTAKLWSLISFQQVATLSPVAAWSSVTFSPDGKALAVRGAEDGQIRLWHAATFEEAQAEIEGRPPASP